MNITKTRHHPSTAQIHDLHPVTAYECVCVCIGQMNEEVDY